MYLQCTQRLFALFAQIESEYVSSPQEFLLYVLQTTLSSEQTGEEKTAVIKTGMKLLQSQYLTSMPYTEFESLVSVEGLQSFVLQKIFSMEAGSEIRKGLVDLYSQIVT